MADSQDSVVTVRFNVTMPESALQRVLDVLEEMGVAAEVVPHEIRVEAENG